MILITHNILWSKYKGGVFSALYKIAKDSGNEIEFMQIAETESDRVGLANVDLSYHQYPYKLMFKGSYGDIPKWLLIKNLFLEIWRSKAEIVVLPGYHLAEYWAMLFAARLRGKIVGVFCDSTAYDRTYSFIKGLFKKLFFSQCNLFFGYGSRSRDYLMSYGAPMTKIYYRVQAAALPKSYDAKQVFLSRLNLLIEKAPQYLYVGRLSPEKNLEDLLHAFKQVLLTCNSARLVIVGGGPIKDNLIALSNQLGLAESVEFAGSKSIEELQIDYLKATCLILPSSSEPWGLVVNEALSYGCPVVVSNRCGCVPELVVEGKTGFVFECGNVNELAAKMTDVLYTFSDVESTAKQCINFISSFSPSAAAQQLMNGCLDALSKSK